MSIGFSQLAIAILGLLVIIESQTPVSSVIRLIVGIVVVALVAVEVYRQGHVRSVPPQ